MTRKRPTKRKKPEPSFTILVPKSQQRLFGLPSRVPVPASRSRRKNA